MKKCLSLCLLFHFGFSIGQNVDIPDPWFKNRLLQANTSTVLKAKDLDGNWTKIDQNDDGEIQVSEAQNISYYIDNFGGSIDSYTGMNSFVNLQELTLVYNSPATPLDLSGLSQLVSLNLYWNHITDLNLSGCTNLEFIQLDGNYVSHLDLSDQVSLQTLHCQNNFMDELILPDNSSLVEIKCFNNNLASLDLTLQPNLQAVYCGNNDISELDLGNCPNLQILQCYQNNLSVLDIGNCPNLNSLFCSYNPALKKMNLNNGFNWIPDSNLLATSLSWPIDQICTSTESVASVQNYYLSQGYDNATGFVSNCTQLGVAEIKEKNHFFYPNPAHDRIAFSEDVTSVVFYTSTGKRVKESDVINGTVEVSGLQPGFFLMKMKTVSGVATAKLVVQ